MRDNPISAFDLLYKGMTEADRTQLDTDIRAILATSVAEVNKELILGVQKAATEAYNSLLVNPWPRLLEERGGNYEFISAIANQIWKSMLELGPKEMNRLPYSMKELIDAWRSKFPEEWAQVVGAKLAEDHAKLQELYEFQVRVNRREI